MQSTLKLKVAGVLAALAIAGLGQPARADMFYPAYGGAGDIQNAIVCPQGQYLKGIRGYADAWIDMLEIMCAPLKPGGHVGGSKTTDRVGGGGGFEKPKGLCDDSLITGVTVFLTNDRRMVAHIDGACRSLISGPTGKSASFGADGWSGAQKFYQSCSDREAAAGFSVHWGEHVNAVGLVCKDLVLP